MIAVFCSPEMISGALVVSLAMIAVRWRLVPVLGHRVRPQAGHDHASERASR
jgi:hypothetical protein